MPKRKAADEAVKAEEAVPVKAVKAEEALPVKAMPKPKKALPVRAMLKPRKAVPHKAMPKQRPTPKKAAPVKAAKAEEAISVKAMPKPPTEPKTLPVPTVPTVEDDVVWCSSQSFGDPTNFPSAWNSGEGMDNDNDDKISSFDGSANFDE